jgi:hypothetical protein
LRRLDSSAIIACAMDKSSDNSTEIINLINNHLELITKTKGELSVLKDQLDESLETNKDYQDAKKETEIAREAKMMAQQKVESSSTVSALVSDLKEKRAELKDLKLVEYYKSTGSSEITTTDGKTYTFSFSVKLS